MSFSLVASSLLCLNELKETKTKSLALSHGSWILGLKRLLWLVGTLPAKAEHKHPGLQIRLTLQNWVIGTQLLDLEGTLVKRALPSAVQA